MKDQKKAKDVVAVEYFSALKFTLDEALDKFSGPEFAPPKLKEAEKKVKNMVIHN